MYEYDSRIVLTLDAGGTNLVFGAIRGCQEIIEPYRLPSVPDDLNRCFQTIVDGFTAVKNHLQEEPVAISFAFPGPADYEHGVIGDLPNFPAFRGGVALGPYLASVFGIPVYINNDGNLFAYGEALAGTLPQINKELQASGSQKRYHNLLGLTLGTGFGAGVVINDNILLTGDNGCGGDIWCMRNLKYPDFIVEESVSIRAVMRVFRELGGDPDPSLTPKDLYLIAENSTNPVQQMAAKESFRELGRMAGAAIANALMIVDGMVVFGGGVANNHRYIMPGVLESLRAKLGTFGGDSFPCLQMSVYNLLDDADRQSFFQDETLQVSVPGSSVQVPYSIGRKIGITISQMGTSKAIQLGAYAFALTQLDLQR